MKVPVNKLLLASNLFLIAVATMLYLSLKREQQRAAANLPNELEWGEITRALHSLRDELQSHEAFLRSAVNPAVDIATNTPAPANVGGEQMPPGYRGREELIIAREQLMTTSLSQRMVALRAKIQTMNELTKPGKETQAQAKQRAEAKYSRPAQIRDLEALHAMLMKQSDALSAELDTLRANVVIRCP